MKETVFAVILTVVLLYAWKQNGYVELYYLLLMILGAKDISEKKLMKVYFGNYNSPLCYCNCSCVDGEN